MTKWEILPFVKLELECLTFIYLFFLAVLYNFIIHHDENV